MKSLIKMHRASKYFKNEGGSVQALREVSLIVEAGKFLAITGPSGCGKSTLLHLLGGMDRVSEGEIWYENSPLHLMSEQELTQFRRSNVGFVFQFFYLLPSLTVQENVALPLQLQKIEDSQKRVFDLLKQVGLSKMANRFPRQLSGGEMQRASIARALVTRPRLLLADEPTGNLDTSNGEIVLKKMRELAGETGTAVVMATHSDNAASFSHSKLEMIDGELTQE